MTSNRLKALIALSLAIIVLFVFWPVGQFDFINYDDGSYVFDNIHVAKGWTLDGIKWAFTTTFHLHWHPLTWLSFMTDTQFFGVNPGVHHWVNLGIHVLNTLLLFYVLTQMTGAVYCCAFVAALFGLHPLHVEPVAWIADRKDVLSAFFWMTTLWSYLRYVRKPGPGNAVWVFVSFMCALMSKSMAVTLPLILLIMDYWPLNRLAAPKVEPMPNSPQPSAKPKSKSGKGKGDRYKKARFADTFMPPVGSDRTAPTVVRLLTEKALLFFPMIIGAGITLMTIQGKRASFIRWPKVIPSFESLYGAITSYAHYLYQMVWPANLSIVYPRVRVFPAWDVLVALSVLFAISLLAYWRRRQNRYLLAGWLWYLVTLLPAIGLIQSGPHAHADRYTYIPLVGIWIMIAWGAADLLAKSPIRRWILASGAAVCIVACMRVSSIQLSRWKDSITIFSQSIKVTENNEIAHNNLGLKLLESGKLDDAISHFKEVIRIRPTNRYAHLNLGLAYRKSNDLEKAIYHYKKALSINSGYDNASYNLANVYLQMNKLDLAEKYFLQTIENNKQQYMAHINLGETYSRMGNSGKAIQHFQESIRIHPEQFLAYYGLGLEYLQASDLDAAESYFNKVLAAKPDYEKAHYAMGIIMLTRKNYDAAIRHFSETLEINPGYPGARQMLEQAQKKRLSGAR